jgi:hypothetical protein
LATLHALQSLPSEPASPKNGLMIWKLSIKAEFLASRREKSTLSRGNEESGFALPESWSILEQPNAGR